jgi:hypothetical protein
VNLVPTELNRQLANAVQYSVAAESFYITGKTGFWRLIGLGILLFGIGAATGIGFYGYSKISRQSSSMASLTSSFSAALSKAQLKGVAEGTVSVAPNEIRLASGQTISLDPRSQVLLDPKAMVRVQGDINIPIPSVSMPQNTVGRSAANFPIITNFTVFKSLPYENGEVYTGWKFLTSTQQFPTAQYCYYTEKSETSPLEPVVYIGVDEKLTPPKQLPKGIDISAAFSRCVWFNKELL